MSSDWSLWWTVAAAAAGLLLLWWRHYSLYFARRGLPYSTPLPIVGNFLDLALRKKSITDVALDIYRRHEAHPYVGVFNFSQRAVMIRDPETVRAITVKDFDHFTDHSSFIGTGKKANQLFQKSLFSLKGKKWHDTRSTLSPAFTSMKMKNMYVFISEIGHQMVEHLKKVTDEHAASFGKGSLLTIEMKDFFTRITNDVIATTAFGLRVNSLSEPENDFYRMGRSLTTVKPLVALGYTFSPWIMEFLNIPFIDRKAENFLKSVVYDTIKNREAQGIVRKDMLHLLMQARRGELVSEEKEHNGTTSNGKVHFDDEDIAAQAMIFFFAGFDTVSTLMSFCSYMLATHQDVQQRLQEEVDELMTKSGGQPTYEQVQSCQYLDMFISETLRYYAPGSFLDRLCVKAYRLPSSDGPSTVELQPGDTVWVPAHGFHHDDRYFPDPEKFDPERFSPENKQNIKPFTYFPFGSGPRVCIAQRFAMLEAKVIILHFLSAFSFQTVPKTPIPLQLSPVGFNLSVKGGTWLGVAPRQPTQKVITEAAQIKAA